MLQSPQRICLPQPLSCVPHFSAAVNYDKRRVESASSRGPGRKGARVSGGDISGRGRKASGAAATAYSSSTGFKPAAPANTQERSRSQVVRSGMHAGGVGVTQVRPSKRHCWPLGHEPQEMVPPQPSSSVPQVL